MKADKQKQEITKETVNLFWRVMPPVWHAMRSRFHEIAAEKYGITSTQLYILRRISQGINSVSDLAECMYISKPGVSRTVDDLVRAGLVNRNRNSNDRRSVMLSLTEKGKTVFGEMHTLVEAGFMRQFNILSKQELIGMRDALENIQKVLKASEKDQKG